MRWLTCVPKKAKLMKVSLVSILICTLCCFYTLSYVKRMTCSEDNCQKPRSTHENTRNNQRSSNVSTSKQLVSSSHFLQKQTEVDLLDHPLQKQQASGSLQKQQDYSSVHSTSNHPQQNQIEEHYSVSSQNEPGYSSAPPLSAHFQDLSQEKIEGVETFVFFIGYGRSGHSIVASMMDAHPSVIIANEYYLFDKLAIQHKYKLQTKLNLFNALYMSSYISTKHGFRASKKTSKGYNLNLNGTWQGQFKKLRVIGDKTAGSTAIMYKKSPALFKKIFQHLQNMVGIPLRQIHVVRNPYDMIATVALYQASGDVDHKKVKASVDNPFNNSTFMEFAADIVLSRALAVVGIVRDYKLNPLEIHLEDLIKDTRSIVTQVCKFIGVPCMEEYIKSCQNKVYRHAIKSRELVMWPRPVLKVVEKAIKEIAFFNRYSFFGE